MDIARYTSYFHDGEIINILNKKNNIEMFLISAEIDPKMIIDIPLSKDNRIKGILHIEGVKLIISDGNELKEKIKMIFPDNDLLHLKIIDSIIFCEINWRGKNSKEIDFSNFEIHATNIWWENIPDL